MVTKTGPSRCYREQAHRPANAIMSARYASRKLLATNLGPFKMSLPDLSIRWTHERGQGLLGSTGARHFISKDS
jgi:hypothetical protein